MDFSVPGQVSITMLDYIKECLAAFDKATPKERGIKTSAAPSDLYTVALEAVESEWAAFDC